MKHELIGKRAEIMHNGVTFKGEIINETKNMVYFKTKKKIKKFIKNSNKLIINNKQINGNNIIKRPEDRVKSCYNKKNGN